MKWINEKRVDAYLPRYEYSSVVAWKSLISVKVI